MNPIFDKNGMTGALLIAGLLLTIAPDRASAQPGSAESRSNIECLDHLEIPEYPPLPRTASIQAVQTVKVLLSDQATIQNIESTLQGKYPTVEKDFKEGAEKALKNSRFSRTCGGKTVTLIFHYEIRDDPNKSSLFAFEAPNQFWIRYGPVYVNPQVWDAQRKAEYVAWAERVVDGFTAPNPLLKAEFDRIILQLQPTLADESRESGSAIRG
jgi:hypothetical protein